MIILIVFCIYLLIERNIFMDDRRAIMSVINLTWLVLLGNWLILETSGILRISWLVCGVSHIRLKTWLYLALRKRWLTLSDIWQIFVKHFYFLSSMNCMHVEPRYGDLSVHHLHDNHVISVDSKTIWLRKSLNHRELAAAPWVKIPTHCLITALTSNRIYDRLSIEFIKNQNVFPSADEGILFGLFEVVIYEKTRKILRQVNLLVKTLFLHIEIII